MRHCVRPSRLLGLVLILSLLATACGGSDEDTAEETATTEPTATATATAAATATATPTPEDTEPTEDPKDEATVPAPAATPTPTPTPVAPTPTATPAPAPAPPVNDQLSSAGDDMGVGGATSYDSYTVVTDDSGAIQVEIPTEWAQIDGRPYNDDAGRQFYDVRASTDLEAFSTGWDVPGIIVNASTDAAQSQNEVALLDERVAAFSSVCTYLGRQPYDDGLYTGQADLFENCAGTETGYLILGAVPDTRAFLIRVEVQVVEERDVEALGQALTTFIIVGDV